MHDLKDKDVIFACAQHVRAADTLSINPAQCLFARLAERGDAGEIADFITKH